MVYVLLDIQLCKGKLPVHRGKTCNCSMHNIVPHRGKPAKVFDQLPTLAFKATQGRNAFYTLEDKFELWIKHFRQPL